MNTKRQSVLGLCLLCAVFFLVVYHTRERPSVPVLLSAGCVPSLEHKEPNLLLPSTVISVREIKARVHQDVAVALFTDTVNASQFPLVDILTEFTPEGFLSSIKPVFAPTRTPVFKKEQILIFLRGDGFIEQCYPSSIEACVANILGWKYEMKSSFPKEGENLSMPPKIIAIMYGVRTTPI